MQLRQGIAVIHRAPGVVQVGTDWGRELVFSKLPPSHEQWLLALGQAARPSPFPYASSLCAPAPPEGSVNIQIMLRQAGYMDSAPLNGPRIMFSGIEAVICDAIDLGLSKGILSSLSIDDPRPYGRDLVQTLGPQGIGHTRQDGVFTHFQRFYPELRRASVKVRDLTVVTCARTLDHGLLGRLLEAEEWHLPILVGEQGVIVGPLVIPGVGACARCLALHMSGRDPDLLQAELCSSRLPLPRLSKAVQARLTLVLGSFLADFFTYWRQRASAEASSAPFVGEAVSILPDGSSIHHSLSPHVECGCVPMCLE